MSWPNRSTPGPKPKKSASGKYRAPAGKGASVNGKVYKHQRAAAAVGEPGNDFQVRHERQKPSMPRVKWLEDGPDGRPKKD